MKIAILFKLEEGAIIGTDEGETGYMCEDLCDSDIFELTVIKAHDSTRVSRFPHDKAQILATETIELEKYIVPTPDGIYRVHCGYGKLSETWVVKGTAEKVIGE